ncbi:MAG: tRNA (cytidine(34)-2'-O)-methyltransferase [Myxococcales bacterium]|nr:tRNA (cytidine(34)-2'-O)-methyltransferase [Myxococcales bacterium]
MRIVLVEPEIPQNTGNVARLAAGLACPLHLVGKLGFSIDEKAVRRAGLDYWPLVTLAQHSDLAHFRAEHPDARLYFFSAVGTRSYLDVPFEPGAALVFGKESVGLSEELLAAHPDDVYSIPTIGPIRSLNLANAVAVVLYEAYRQLGAFDSLASIALAGNATDSLGSDAIDAGTAVE